MQSLATANVNNVRVGRGDGDRADRLRRLVVEDRIPGAAVVVRLPDSSVDLSNIENVRLAGDSAGSARAPAAQRADHAPVQVLVRVFGNVCPCAIGRKENYAARERTEDCMSSFHQDPPENVQHKPYKETQKDHDACIKMVAWGQPPSAVQPSEARRSAQHPLPPSRPNS